MKRFVLGLSVAGFFLGIAADGVPPPPRKRPHPPRAPVVVRKGFPLRRALPPVVVAPPRVAVKVLPARYLVPVVWVPVAVPEPGHGRLAWEDSQEIEGQDGWTDFILNTDTRGRKLFFAVTSGSVQLSFAEVVFANGEAQVVDGNDLTRGPGLYPLLDFADGRRVDHVRMVARTDGATATVALRMLK